MEEYTSNFVICAVLADGLAPWGTGAYAGAMRNFLVMPRVCYFTLIARFIGPSWGSSGADRTQVGPMLAPWTLHNFIYPVSPGCYMAPNINAGLSEESTPHPLFSSYRNITDHGTILLIIKQCLWWIKTIHRYQWPILRVQTDTKTWIKLLHAYYTKGCNYSRRFS